jgi:hypothetical protein
MKGFEVVAVEASELLDCPPSFGILGGMEEAIVIPIEYKDVHWPRGGGAHDKFS